MRKILLLLLLALPLLLWGCSDDDDGGNPTDPVTPEEAAAADSTATEALSDLMDEMEDAMGEDFDPDDLDDLMDMDLTPIQESANDAIELDPDCVTAHFVLALVEMFLMSQDGGLEDLLEELEGEFGGADLPLGLATESMSPARLLSGGLLGRSFEIMHHAPLAMVPQEMQLALPAAKADGPLIRGMQTHVRNVMLPATDSIVGHLAVVESQPDWELLIIDDSAEPDTTELDLGEVYVLDAVVRALRSGLQLVTAYDVEIAPDGDYDWLTEGMQYNGYTDYEVRTGTAAGDTLYLYDDEYEEILQEDALYTEFANLLAPGSDFLTLWTDPWSGDDAMQAAYDEMNLLLSRLESAYTFILAEGDDQGDDVITQMLILELDEAVAEIGGDLPEWLGTFETIPDIIAWIESIMSGPYTIPVELDEETTFDLTVNISALFLTPVADWKTKLPYMEWLEMEDWAEPDGGYWGGPYYHGATSPFVATVNGEEMSFNNILYYYIVSEYWDSDAPVAFLDGPDGDPIEEGFPFFPDYTLGGLFPDMARADWLTLLGIEEL